MRLSMSGTHTTNTEARTLHDQLMGAGDQGEAVIVVEGLADVLAERVASTTRRDAPATAIVWIRPKQVAHRSLVRHLLHTINGPYVVQGID